MPHGSVLITTIVVGLVLAFALGFLAHRLRLPPLVGYLLAGVFVGPFTPGFVADANLAGQLAEIGVILLMFGVGLHFSIRLGVSGGRAQGLVRLAILEGARQSGKRPLDTGAGRCPARAGTMALARTGSLRRSP